MSNLNTPGADADSASAWIYRAGAYVNTVPLDTTAAADLILWHWMCDTATTATLGPVHIVYRVYDGNDTLLASETYWVGMSALDTIFAAAPHDGNWGGTAAGAGEDATPIYMFAVDTLNDVRLDGIPITMYKAGSSLGTVLTSSDTAKFNGLDGVTTYTFEAYASHSYTFETGVGFTCSAPSDVDSIMGYPFSPGTPGDADLKRIYGWIKDAGDNPLVGAIVSLAMDVPGDTIPRGLGTEVTIYRTAVRDTTDADGYWSLDIYPEDGVTPRGIEYYYRVTHNGKYLLSHYMKFTPTGTNAQAITEF